MKVYADWFFKTHLIPHFEFEETCIFTVLKSNNKLVKKALMQHRRLRRLFTKTDEVSNTLSKIEQELEQHIRFEERILFSEIQKVASKAQFAHIEKIHQAESFKDKRDDEFWK